MSSTELATIEVPAETALAVYSTAGGLDPYIEKIKATARAEAASYDPSTEAGRKGLSSLDRRLGGLKNRLDEKGTQLTADQRAIIDKVNAERSKAWKEMEALQAEIYAPVEEFKTREKKRVAALEARINEIVSAGENLPIDPSIDEIKARIEKLRIPENEPAWDEFSIRAKSEREKIGTRLSEMLAAREKRDAEAAELARLQKIEADRLQKEREDKIAEEAAEKARKEAEAAAAAKAAEEALAVAMDAAYQEALTEDVQRTADAEKRKAERDAEELKQRLAKAESDRVAAEKKAADEKRAAAEKAEKEKNDAIEKERAKVAKEAADKKAADDARAADIAHRGKINSAAVQMFVDNGIETDLAKKVITLIAQGKIPNISIKY